MTKLKSSQLAFNTRSVVLFLSAYMCVHVTVSA